MPGPQEYNEGGFANLKVGGPYLVKVNPDPELDERLRLGWVDKGAGKWTYNMPLWGAEGQITDFIPVHPKAMFRFQNFLAALSGKMWKKEQKPGDNTDMFIYDKLLPTSDPKKLITWTLVFSQFANFDTAAGRQKFHDWVLEKSGRPFWISVRSKVNQDGQPSRFGEVNPFPPDAPQRCEDGDINKWSPPKQDDAEEASAEEETAGSPF